MGDAPLLSLSSIFAPPRFADFRRSDDIEDRRRQRFVPTPGVFGNGVDLGNVFDNGLLTGLKQGDFHNPGPPEQNPLGIALGLRDLLKSGPLGSPNMNPPQGGFGTLADQGRP